MKKVFGLFLGHVMANYDWSLSTNVMFIMCFIHLSKEYCSPNESDIQRCGNNTQVTKLVFSAGSVLNVFCVICTLRKSISSLFCLSAALLSGNLQIVLYQVKTGYYSGNLEDTSTSTVDQEKL